MMVLDYANDATRRDREDAAQSYVCAAAPALGYTPVHTACGHTRPQTQLPCCAHSHSICAIIMPDAILSVGRVWAAVERAGLKIAQARSLAITPADAQALGPAVPRAIASGRSIALEIMGSDAGEVWAGVAASLEARLPAGSLYAATSSAQAATLLAAIFGKGMPGRATQFAPELGASSRLPTGAAPAAADLPRLESVQRSTAAMRGSVAVAVILPHVVRAGKAGELLSELIDGACVAGGGLAITALQTFDLDLVTAEEFYEVYKSVVPEFPDMAAELSAGVCVTVELAGPDAVSSLRKLAGPRDVSIAQRLRPKSLRARYGETPARCGVHVTDLVEDGETESEYFFSILSE